MDLQVDDFIIFDLDTTSSPPYSPTLVDPWDKDTIDNIFSTKFKLPVHIPPFQRVLLSTRDEVEVLPKTVGLIQLRNTWARLGLMSSPTYVDPGFKGTLTLSIFNASHNKILLRPTDKIWSFLIILLNLVKLLWTSLQVQGVS
jgi:deoxycytidine triphosphate deaminase